jgi:sec-independent protein translocase protein TatA
MQRDAGLCDNGKSDLRTFASGGWRPGWIPGEDIMLDNLFTPTHLLIILVIALLIFGPRKLPELGKGLGEGLKGFKDGIKGASSDPAKQENAAKSEATPQTK